jgi:hypothetical protein
VNELEKLLPVGRKRRFVEPIWYEEFLDAGHRAARDGTVVLFHATTAAKARKIVKEGVLRRPPDAPDSYGVYFSTSPDVANEYGDGTLVVLRAPVEDLNISDAFPSGRMDFYAKTFRGVYRPIAMAVFGCSESRKQNPQVAGWLTPGGEFIPLTRGEHFHLAAKRLGVRTTPRATRIALEKGWVRLGDMTVQFSSKNKRKSLLMARDFYREVFADKPPKYEILVEWDVKGSFGDTDYTIVSYRVPVADFLEIGGVGDLMRYPHQRVYTEVWEID